MAARSPFAGQPLQVTVVIKGGVVQTVAAAGHPVEVTVLDYSCEGSDPVAVDDEGEAVDVTHHVGEDDPTLVGRSALLVHMQHGEHVVPQALIDQHVLAPIASAPKTVAMVNRALSEIDLDNVGLSALSEALHVLPASVHERFFDALRADIRARWDADQATPAQTNGAAAPASPSPR